MVIQTVIAIIPSGSKPLKNAYIKNRTAPAMTKFAGTTNSSNITVIINNRPLHILITFFKTFVYFN